MRKLLFIALLAIPFCSAKAQNAPAAGSDTSTGLKSITVTPARLSFNLKRGESGKQSVTITNSTSKKYLLTMDFVDWLRDTLGRHVYIAPGTSKQSCANWVTFDKPSVDLGAGQSTTVTVTMKVPDTDEAVSEMKWTMLTISNVTEKIAPSRNVLLRTQINKSMGLGVHIYQTPPNVTSKELKMLSFSQLAGKNTYRIACKNVGGVQLNGKFSIELASAETGAKTALEPKVVPLFPQQDRYVDFTLPDALAKGKYTAIALIDAEDEDVPIEAAQKEIEVK